MLSETTRSDAVLKRLLALHPKKIDLALDRILRLLAALGNPHLKLAPVIHVAGTNGKGSACAFARAMLEAQGLKVHVHTSPHLVRFHERIRLGGKLISEEALVSLLEATPAPLPKSACRPDGCAHENAPDAARCGHAPSGLAPPAWRGRKRRPSPCRWCRRHGSPAPA